MKSTPKQRSHIADLMRRRGFADDGGVIGGQEVTEGAEELCDCGHDESQHDI